MSMKAGDWAAWVQAVGSIAAICAGFGTAYLQNRKGEELRERDRVMRERDRVDRAEVVAFRLSGWLSEVGSRLIVARERYDQLRIHNRVELPQPNQVAFLLTLDVVVGIDDVMSDLHYLKAGTGDVAQLNYHVRFFNAFVAMTKERRDFSKSELSSFYDEVERHLKNMQGLHSNAERHLTPIIDAAVARER